MKDVVAMIVLQIVHARARLGGRNYGDLILGDENPRKWKVRSMAAKADCWADFRVVEVPRMVEPLEPCQSLWLCHK
jgi:hypothetical protein